MREELGERATNELMFWLTASGYFKCPAAKSHHGNHEGGLFEHSLAVAEELQRLTDKLGLSWEREESPYVVGLLHDVCKMDDYVYDWETGVIEFKPSHSGHGSKSVIMLAGRFDLTEEEKMCILYHMGSFTDKEEWKYYSNAVREYPNVLYTHMADMIASQIRGI